MITIGLTQNLSIFHKYKVSLHKRAPPGGGTYVHSLWIAVKFISVTCKVDLNVFLAPPTDSRGVTMMDLVTQIQHLSCVLDEEFTCFCFFFLSSVFALELSILE